MKPKRKRISRNQAIVIVVIIVVVVWVIYSAITPTPPSTSPVSTTIPSSSSSSLLAGSNFEVQSFSEQCHSDGGLFVSFQLGDNKSIPFHFVSATVVFVNYTLSDGTVVPVTNEQVVDNTPTYDTTHQISGQFKMLISPSNETMTHAWFIITSNILEVPAPVAIPFRTTGCSIG